MFEKYAKPKKNKRRKTRKNVYEKKSKIAKQKDANRQVYILFLPKIFFVFLWPKNQSLLVLWAAFFMPNNLANRSALNSSFSLTISQIGNRIIAGTEFFILFPKFFENFFKKFFEIFLRIFWIFFKNFFENFLEVLWKFLFYTNTKLINISIIIIILSKRCCWSVTQKYGQVALFSIV